VSRYEGGGVGEEQRNRRYVSNVRDGKKVSEKELLGR
jgi:hypothetical protein